MRDPIDALKKGAVCLPDRDRAAFLDEEVVDLKQEIAVKDEAIAALKRKVNAYKGYAARLVNDDLKARSQLIAGINPVGKTQPAGSAMATSQQDVAFDEARRAYVLGQHGQQDQARALNEAAAEHGNAIAQYNLAVMLSQGEGGAPDKYRAFAWFEKAASAGVPQAMHNTAVFLDEGKYVPTDKKLAAQWYRRAAELGVPRSQTNLALMLFNGEGVPKNEAEAFSLFVAAAETGEPSAQQSVAAILSRSVRLDDQAAALKWLYVRSREGDSYAIQWAARVSEKLSAAQVAWAKEQANRWRALPSRYPEGLIQP